MQTKLVALALIVGTSGCSWLFQDRMRGGLAGYDGNEEPRCTTSKGWSVLDGAFAAFGGASILIGATDDSLTSGESTSLIVGGVLDLLVHGASSITGSSWANECRRAYAEYQGEASSPPPDAELERVRAQIERNGGSVEPVAPQVPAIPTARGYYCASSNTVVAAGLCTREKADCVRARDAALAVITDITECTLVETAQCFGDRCSPTAESCIAQRERAAATAECKETK